mmetsp:Transcript_18559/g.46748  ORF Transcript_18559/g.46748 Transcript_18559/m.46748 type:complete len:273 (-) Transcript_18559:1494-2312(-)
MDSFTSAKSRSHCPSCSLDWSMRCISWSSRRRVDSISLLRIAISDAASSSARFDSSFFSSRERTMARRRPCSSLAMRSLHSISVRNFCISTSFLSFSISGAAFTSLSSLPTWMRRFILSSSTLTKAFFDSVFSTSAFSSSSRRLGSSSLISSASAVISSSLTLACSCPSLSCSASSRAACSSDRDSASALRREYASAPSSESMDPIPAKFSPFAFTPVVLSKYCSCCCSCIFSFSSCLTLSLSSSTVSSKSLLLCSDSLSCSSALMRRFLYS